MEAGSKSDAAERGQPEHSRGPGLWLWFWREQAVDRKPRVDAAFNRQPRLQALGEHSALDRIASQFRQCRLTALDFANRKPGRGTLFLGRQQRVQQEWGWQKHLVIQ